MTPTPTLHKSFEDVLLSLTALEKLQRFRAIKGPNAGREFVIEPMNAGMVLKKTYLDTGEVELFVPPQESHP